MYKRKWDDFGDVNAGEFMAALISITKDAQDQATSVDPEEPNEERFLINLLMDSCYYNRHVMMPNSDEAAFHKLGNLILKKLEELQEKGDLFKPPAELILLKPKEGE